MNRIKIDIDRVLGDIDRNIFGMFKEIGPNNRILGIYQPDSQFADDDGFRTDVLDAARRLRVSNVRGLGGNSISGYRWLDLLAA